MHPEGVAPCVHLTALCLAPSDCLSERSMLKGHDDGELLSSLESPSYLDANSSSLRVQSNPLRIVTESKADVGGPSSPQDARGRSSSLGSNHSAESFASKSSVNELKAIAAQVPPLPNSTSQSDCFCLQSLTCTFHYA